MKTIEEKAKAYDEALERAKDYYKANLKLDKEEENLILEDIFPELQESEDEKIRKTLIGFFRRGAENGEQTNGVYDRDIIAWLEKQGEKPQGKSEIERVRRAIEAIKEKPADNANKVASAWNNGYSNGYIHAIDKACEWLENHNDYIDVKDGNVTYFDMEKCVEDFKKAMEHE